MRTFLMALCIVIFPHHGSCQEIYRPEKIYLESAYPRKLPISIQQPSSTKKLGCVPVFVLIHGLLSDPSTWAPLVSHLPDSTIITFPLYGSEEVLTKSRRTPRATLHRDAQDLLRVLGYWISRDSSECGVYLIGHSYGAAIIVSALASLAGNPGASDIVASIHGLVLISSPSPNAPEIPEPIREVADLPSIKRFFGRVFGAVERRVRESAKAWYCDLSLATERQIARIVSWIENPKKHRLLRERVGSLSRDIEGGLPKKLSQLSSISQEVLLICGDLDSVIPCDKSVGFRQYLLSQRQGALAEPVRLVQLPAMHSPHVEQARRVAELIRQMTRSGEGAWIHEPTLSPMTQSCDHVGRGDKAWVATEEEK